MALLRVTRTAATQRMARCNWVEPSQGQ